MKLFRFEHDLFADAGKDFLGGVVESATEKVEVVGGFEVDIIACHTGFFTFGTDINAMPIFVGALVLGEADITVYAVHAVFDFEAFASRIEFLNATDQGFCHSCQLLLGSFVFGTVGIEPGFIVVLGKAEIEI